MDLSATGLRLRPGEPYQVGVDSCLSDPSQSFSIIFEDIMISSFDDDGDGRYTGSFTYNPGAARIAAATSLRIDITSGGAARSFTMPLSNAEAGSVTDSQSGQGIVGATVTALAPSGDAWPAEALGAANPQTSSASGGYSFGAASDTSRIAVSVSGYQPYRSWEIAGAALDRAIRLTPEMSGTPDATIYITANGFNPPLLTVRPGALVEWVNLDLAEHSATAATWESGALVAGGRYRMRVGQATISYHDAANARSTGTLLIDGRSTVYLPLVLR
jgi:plastocyanin